MAISSLEQAANRQQRTIDKAIVQAANTLPIIEGMRTASYPGGSIINGYFDEDGVFVEYFLIGSALGSAPLKPSL